MDGRKNRKIRNFLINRDLQIRVMSTSLIYMILAVLVTISIMLYPQIRGMFTETDIDLQYQAAKTFLDLSARLIPAMLLVFILFFLQQLLLTHRILGPLVNFRHTFDKLAAGDLTRKVVLRQGDLLLDECEKINSMIDGLTKLLVRVKNDHELLIGELGNIADAIDDPDVKKRIEESLAMVQKEARLISHDLESFKIETMEPACNNR